MDVVGLSQAVKARIGRIHNNFFILYPFNFLVKDRHGMLGGRGVRNHYGIDSAAFGFPLLYNRQLPDLLSQG